MKKLLTTTALSLLLVSLASGVYGQDFQPAVFGDYKQDFISKIEIPELTNAFTITILCSGVISTRGRFDPDKVALCYEVYDIQGLDPDQMEEIVDSVVFATRNLRVNEASVDGKRKRVWFNFHVQIIKQEETLAIKVNENHLRIAEEYGNEYVSAQRYAVRRARGPFCTAPLDMLFISVTTVVSEVGLPSQMKITEDINPDKRCLDSINVKLERSAFIPAFFDLEPISSIYIEPFYNMARTATNRIRADMNHSVSRPRPRNPFRN